MDRSVKRKRVIPINLNLPRAIFGSGPTTGYDIQTASGNISSDERSQLLDFCKTVEWTPKKHDYPDFKAVCLLPTGDRAWLCIIGEGKPDKFKRQTLTVNATLVALSLELINEAIADFGKELDVDIPSIEELPSSKSPTFLVQDTKLLRCAGMSENRRKYSGSQPAVKPKVKAPQEQPGTSVPQSRRAPAGKKNSIWMPIPMFCIGGIVTATVMYLFPINRLNDKLKDVSTNLEDVSTTLRKTFLREDDEVTSAAIRQAHEDHDQELKASDDALKAFRQAAAVALGQPDDLETLQDLESAIAKFKSDLEDEKKTALSELREKLLAEIAEMSEKNDLSEDQNIYLTEAMKELDRLSIYIDVINNGETPFPEVVQKIKMLSEPLDRSLELLKQLQNSSKGFVERLIP